jgi:phosphoribosylanthranilate isomerase
MFSEDSGATFRAPARTRVKICGITRVSDAVLAANLGADAVGLVFYGASPRAVGHSRAIDIVHVLPPFVSVIGLFVNPAPREVVQVLESIRVDYLQFHGDESPEYCLSFGRPYLKAVAMRKGIDVGDYARRYRDASALLLDTYRADRRGGTGKTFDWSLVPSVSTKPIILAGGLTPENVAEAVTRVRPFAVDVSGGVESSKGKKDAHKMAAFIGSVNNVKASA